MTPAERDFSQLHVLVAEDGAFIRGVMSQLLKGLGVIHVTFATNGNEALEIVRGGELPVDVVLCDLQMPDMDGVELVRHAAEFPRPPAFAYISGAHAAMLSAAADLARNRGISVLGTIGKPASRAAIAAILDRYLATPAATRSGADVMKASFLPTAADVEAALVGDQFELFYQPKVDVRSENLGGFEALIRWRHPEAGLIPPGAFIALAERGSVIGPLTDWVIAAALRTTAQWSAAGLATKVSINLSVNTLVDLSFPDRIAAQARQAGVDPRRIILEITESGAFNNSANTLDILARLHLKGFALSIDDFGTGFSSMEQLRRVPFTEMKIDRAFVHGAARDRRMHAILESSAGLARNLGMSIVAEGAETAEDIGAIKGIGIDLVQGFYYGRPMTADDAFKWAAARKS